MNDNKKIPIKGNYRTQREFLNGNSCNVKNVKQGIAYWRRYLLSRCANILEWEGLPDTINSWAIMSSLIMKGYVVFVKKNGKLYVPFQADVYGYDVYMTPNKVTYANPVIGGDGGLIDGKNCVIVWNMEADKFGGSTLWNIINRYSVLLAHTDSTFCNQLINSRSSIIGQSSNATASAALQSLFDKIEAEGSMTAVLNKTLPLDSIKFEQLAPLSNFSWYSDTRTYLLNQFLSEIGFETTDTTKKERIQSFDVVANQDLLTNNINLMYSSVSTYIKKVNELFGTNISVRKNPITRVDNIGDEEPQINDKEDEENVSE